MDAGQLFRGHTKFCQVYTARNQAQLRDSVLRHVSAHGLTSLLAPSSLRYHNTMLPTNKTIWDAAYDEEFDGLASLKLLYEQNMCTEVERKWCFLLWNN